MKHKLLYLFIYIPLFLVLKNTSHLRIVAVFRAMMQVLHKFNFGGVDNEILRDLINHLAWRL